MESVRSQEKSLKENFYFVGPNDWALHGRLWRTEQKSKGTIIGVHGYSEHSLCYAHLADYLNQNSYNSIWLDLPGHGLSQDRRNNIDRFEDYILSVDALIEQAHQRGCPGPYHMFAHSLGGLVAMRFQQTSPNASQIQSLTLSSPLIGIYAFQNKKILLMKILSFILPNITVPNTEEIGEEVLTHDLEMREKRLADVLIKPIVTIHWCREYLKARASLFKDVKKLSVPIGFLIAYLARDELIDGRKWFEILFILGFLFGVGLYLYGLKYGSYTSLFIAVISLISYILSFNKKWTKID